MTMFAGTASPIKPPSAEKSEIERGTLSGAVKASGSLQYADPRDVESTIGGVLTTAPQPGATVGIGQSLFSVDNIPVFLFRGPLPAWRTFESDMNDGPDVRQLEETLASLGYFENEPDEKFTWATNTAIRAWQKATGQKQTGSIDLGRIIFGDGDVRVQAVKMRVGKSVGGGSAILSVTDLHQQVNVKLPLANQQVAKLDGPVSISLPNGQKTAGKVVSVGTPLQEDDKSVSIPVVVALDDPTASGDLQQASVTVSFPSEVRENVLSIPVVALIALDENNFGVELADSDGSSSRRVPVTTGLFAGGRVEISGDGLEAGHQVVIPKL